MNRDSQFSQEQYNEHNRALQLLAKAKEIEAKKLDRLVARRINRRTVIYASPQTIDYYASKLDGDGSNGGRIAFPNYPEWMRNRDKSKGKKNGGYSLC